MSRPSEIYTKTVSVRIPMDSYIDLLQKATTNKMSLSEYMTMKLLSKNSENGLKAEKTDEIDTKKENKKQEPKQNWILKDTFKNKADFKHPAFENANVPSKLGKGRDLLSRCGKWKLVTVKNAHHRIYKLSK